MSSDNQFTALGPAIIGFQTNSASIDVGGDIFGNQVGVKGRCDGGNGVEGISSEGTADKPNNNGVGVFGLGPAAGVRGVGGKAALDFISDANGVEGFAEAGVGVSGFSQQSVGVRGHSQSDDGVVGLCDANGKSGMFGFNSRNDGVAFGVFGRCDSPAGAGVSGRNDRGDAVTGFSPKGVGIRGTSNGNDGVVGHSEASFRSGVYGENTAAPIPLVGEPPVGGGVLGGGPRIRREVFGVTGRANAASGTGVFGDSANGVGIRGKGGQYGAIFEGGIAPLRLNPASNSGAPTIGFHQMGEFFVDSNGDLFYCKVAGTPGTWFKVSLTPA